MQTECRVTLALVGAEIIEQEKESISQIWLVMS